MSQIRCGNLSLSSDPAVEFIGRVRLSSRINDQIIFRKHPRAAGSGDAGSKSPDYEVFKRTADGEVNLGAAWIKNGSNGDFLSITLDDPDWSSPLNLTAFPPARERGETSWQVIWSRPRARVAANEMEAA
jgi:uncharacterized protein (DUF736 family)